MKHSYLIFIFLLLFYITGCGGGDNTGKALREEPNLVSGELYPINLTVKSLNSGSLNIKVGGSDITIINLEKIKTEKGDFYISNQGKNQITHYSGAFFGSIMKDKYKYIIETQNGQVYISKRNRSFYTPHKGLQSKTRNLRPENNLLLRSKSNSVSIINILFIIRNDFYHKATKTEVETNIINTLNNLNISLENSGITTTSFQLAAIERLDIDDLYYKTIDQIVVDFSNNAPAKIEQLRNQHKADLVAIIRPSSNYGWSGYAIYSVTNNIEKMSNWAYSAYDIGGNSIYVDSISHEIGHNFGCSHDLSIQSEPYINYAKGYQNSEICTILSNGYYCKGKEEIPYYSNPLIKYKGNIIGISGEGKGAANCAKLINTTGPIIAKYRPLIARITANDDSFSLKKGEQANFDILGNDSYTGNTVVSIISYPVYGQVQVLSSGEISYTSNNFYVGIDSFVYKISSNDESATAKVTVNTLDINRAPIAVNDEYIIQLPNKTITGNLLVNDSDPDGDILTVDLGSISNGNVNISSSTGEFTFTINDDFIGISEFTYIIDDGNNGTATGRVRIQVLAEINNAPKANNDQYEFYCRAEYMGDVSTNDIDIDNDHLTFTVTTEPSLASSFTFNNNGSFTYRAGEQTGSDNFSYEISDGKATDSADVSITVVDSGKCVTPPPIAPPPVF